MLGVLGQKLSVRLHGTLIKEGHNLSLRFGVASKAKTLVSKLVGLQETFKLSLFNLNFAQMTRPLGFRCKHEMGVGQIPLLSNR